MTGTFRPQANVFTNLAQGYMQGKQNKKDEAKERKRKTIQQQTNQLMGLAIEGDPTAMQQLGQVDPQQAMAVQKHIASLQKPASGGMGQDKAIDLKAKASKAMQESMSRIALLPEEMQQEALQGAAKRHQKTYGEFSALPAEIGEKEQALFGQIKQQKTQEAAEVAKKAATGRSDVYRNKFSQAYAPLSNVKSSVSMISGLIDRAITEDSGIADQSAIIGIMKALDPGSVVSTAEGQTIAQSESLPGQFMTAVNKMLSGEKLSDNIRKDIMNTASEVLKQKELAFFSQMQPYVEAARDQEGLDVASFMGDTLSNDFSEWEKGGAGLGLKTYDDKVSSKVEQTYNSNIATQKDKIMAADKKEADKKASSTNLSDDELLNRYLN